MIPCMYYKIGYYVETKSHKDSVSKISIFWSRDRKNRYINRLKESFSVSAKYTKDPDTILLVDENDIVKFTISIKIIYFYTSVFYNDVPENILFYICKDVNCDLTRIIIGGDSYESLLFGLVKQKMISIDCEYEKIKDDIINGNFDDYFEFAE